MALVIFDNCLASAGALSRKALLSMESKDYRFLSLLSAFDYVEQTSFLVNTMSRLIQAPRLNKETIYSLNMKCPP